MYRRRSPRAFTMLEVVFALGLLVLLAAAFTTTLNLVFRQNRLFTQENRALLVLDNTIERLAARPSRTLTDAKAVFLDEYRESGLAADPELVPVCDLAKDRLVLAIGKKDRKPLARVEFTCKPD